jgi:hypothetical protein
MGQKLAVVVTGATGKQARGHLGSATVRRSTGHERRSE